MEKSGFKINLHYPKCETVILKVLRVIVEEIKFSFVLIFWSTKLNKIILQSDNMIQQEQKWFFDMCASKIVSNIDLPIIMSFSKIMIIWGRV